MKYLRNHKDFAKHINEVLDLNIPEEELERIDEAFENDVTLSNSLVGQLFGWIFRKIGGVIQKGKMNSLLKELANEFGKGHYSAVRHKKIAKKNLLYSTIVGLKKMASDKELSDEEFEKKFPKMLDKSIEDIRELIEGKGDVRISDDSPEMMKVAKDFYKKLGELSGKEIELKKTLDDVEDAEEIADINARDEEELVDESIGLNIPEGLASQLEIAGDSKIEVIAANLEYQLSKEVIYENNMLKIQEVSSLSFKEIDRYFKALDISIEMINDTILIDNYNRFESLLEYSTNGNIEFIYDLRDEIESVLNANTPSGKIKGVSVSKDRDYEEKGEYVYNAIFGIMKKHGVNFEKYTQMVNNTGDKDLIKGLSQITKYIDKFRHSKNDATGFKNNYSNLIRSLEYTENTLSRIISEIGEEESGRKFHKDNESETDSGVVLKKGKDGKEFIINNKKWSKINRVKYKSKSGDIKEARPNPNPPDDIEFDNISLIDSKGNTFAIPGDRIVEVDGLNVEPHGILNKDQLRRREESEQEKLDISKWLDESDWLYGKEIEYQSDRGKSSAMVLSKEEQIQNVKNVGALYVKYSIGNKGILPDIESKLISVDGKLVNRKEKAANRDYVRSTINVLFPDDDLYEKELILNERDKKDLLNDIKHKAKNKETLINPLQVMKIFNAAHHKYTVDDYANIPDGSQGSSLQGKGQGVNKKKHYKQMPDGSGRHVVLFKQWNDGVIDLLEEYGEYVPDKLKKFIINILDNNKLYGNGGAQAKLLGDYFNIKVDIEDIGIGERGAGSAVKPKTTKADIYINTNDTTGKFEIAKSGSLQLKKENFENVPFILKGNQKGQEPTAYVCYYMGTVGDLILFKFKTNNMDFLNNYKRSEQQLKEQEFQGMSGDEVYYGAIRSPKGANKDLKEKSEIVMWFTDVRLEEPIQNGNFGIDNVYYLQGINDGGVMRLDTKNPGSDYGDFQHEDFKLVQQKFSALRA